MNSSIENIIARLDLQDQDSQGDYGLWKGKAGFAIINYLLSKIKDSSIYAEKALALFNEISEHIASVNKIDFENGLIGIGWAIEWASQNNFLDVNSNEILEDVDDAIYKSVMYAPDNDFYLGTGTLGKLAYFSMRIQNNKEALHRFKKLVFEECLVVLTDELHDKLLEGENSLYKGKMNGNYVYLINLGQAIIFTSKFLQKKINEPTIEKTLYRTIEFIDQFLKLECDKLIENKSGYSNKYLFSLQYLAVCYLGSGIYHNHTYWQREATTILDCVLSLAPISGIMLEEDFIQQIMVYSLYNFYCPKLSYKEKIIGLLQSIDLSSLPGQLHYGKGSILLAVVGLSNMDMEIVKKLDELIWL